MLFDVRYHVDFLMFKNEQRNNATMSLGAYTCGGCDWVYNLPSDGKRIKIVKFSIDISVEKTKSHIRCGCRKATTPLVEGTHECHLLLVVFRTQ